MNDVTTESLILEEVRAVRASLEELSSEALQRITRLETKTKPIFDNGQPGVLTQQNLRIASLENWRTYTLGAAGAIAAIVTLIFRLWK